MSRRQALVVYVDDPETGESVEHTLPSKFEVCPRCEGTGSHTNPNIDGNGISPEQFHDDPDFGEAYFRGDYDVGCEECGGLRVVPVVDEAKADPALLKAWEAQERESAECDAIERAERRAEMWAAGERD